MTVHFINNTAVTAAAARAAEAALAPATDDGKHDAQATSTRALTRRELNVSALAREFNVDRRTIKRWQAKGWTPPPSRPSKLLSQIKMCPGVPTPPGRSWLLGLTCGALGLALVRPVWPRKS
jgi:hypothetical protein